MSIIQGQINPYFTKNVNPTASLTVKYPCFFYGFPRNVEGGACELREWWLGDDGKSILLRSIPITDCNTNCVYRSAWGVIIVHREGWLSKQARSPPSPTPTATPKFPASKRQILRWNQIEMSPKWWIDAQRQKGEKLFLAAVEISCQMKVSRNCWLV